MRIKLNNASPEDWQKTIDAIKKKWNLFYPSEYFSCNFYDESLEVIYKQERNISRLISMATVVSIIISCLGLFGLASLTAFQRTKEIGIRKVLGATVAGIMKMLSIDFAKLVLVSVAIGMPVAWYAMNKWLEGFAYRIHIQWWMLLAGGVSVMVIALFTVSFQAFRAASAKPVDSLKNE